LTLEFTGERFTPECEREIAYEHWHRYAWAQQLLAGRDVVDAACGEGYGSYLLSQRAQSVVGIDLSEQSIEHARRRYGAGNLSFQCANCLELPLDDASVDAVVSFETLEHLAEHDQLLEEFKRVLRPDGCLVISSPDRKTYSDETGYDNPFHVRELYRPEFEALMNQHFPVWRLFGQKLAFSSLVWSLAERGTQSQWLTADDRGAVSAAASPQLPPMYFIAVAALTEQALPDIPAQSLYGDTRESVYAHYYDVIRKHIRGEQLLAERDAEIAALKHKLETPWWKRWLADR
jgi:SAM-dependent methyltransferase